MLDGTRWASYPDSTDAPPPAPDSTSMNYLSIRPFCIPRHGGFVNCLFMDWSVRKVGLKQLWTLRWYPGCNTSGAYTLAGHADAGKWPAWMRGYRDY